MTTVNLSLTSYSRAAVLAVALLSIAAAVPASAAVTSADQKRPQVVVRYADLNLDSDAGALALYRRIAAAARRVCPNDRPRELGRAQAVRTCRDQAIARAIDAVGSARLAAIQAVQTARARVG